MIPGFDLFKPQFEQKVALEVTGLQQPLVQSWLNRKVFDLKEILVGRRKLRMFSAADIIALRITSLMIDHPLSCQPSDAARLAEYMIEHRVSVVHKYASAEEADESAYVGLNAMAILYRNGDDVICDFVNIEDQFNQITVFNSDHNSTMVVSLVMIDKIYTDTMKKIIMVKDA